MLRIINIFEILKNYWNDINDDLNFLSKIVILLIFPIALSCLLDYLIEDKKTFLVSIITVNSILIPLLINVLMIVYYSIERTKSNEILSKKSDPNKLKLLKHINTTIMMTTLLSFFLLIIALVVNSFEKVGLIIYVVYFLFSFVAIHMLIIMKRIFILINYEIQE